MNWQNYKIVESIKEQLDSFVNQPFYLLGKQTKAFEEKFSEYSQVEHCISLASGTVALQLLIRALNLKQGAKILVTSFCPIPTIMAILQEGFVPKFVDIEEHSLNISKKTLESAFDLECKAVIAVHIFGKICPMDEISVYCKENKLGLIEDACQAVGASHIDYKIGELSLGAAMSFYPTKNLGAWGDAGAILTNDSEINHKVACIRNYGLNEFFQSESIGGNYRMDDFQAMILLEKFQFLEEEKQIRQDIVDKYNSYLDLSYFQKIDPQEQLNHHVIPYLLDSSTNRNLVRELYKSFDLRMTFHYEKPVFHFHALNHLTPEKMPITEKICERIINLPIAKSSDEFHEKLAKIVL
ncbi:DegT/DnrJ/EryC1/StrS family aminotransferase [bacterium]|nr:DegT/DnrJ/EryC1/StrS family aminotransferase [bacterium]